ncbi:MAG: DUF3795 domain-containing protein [Candidatus Delongbacteria bacterium]|nr:DUF3795 domain-containing protein [Candidatus Delongbacteria bacterium]
MTDRISSCGLNCRECQFYNQPCEGCYIIQGRPFWAEELPGEVCPLFDCASTQEFTSCGQCSQLPCQKFKDLKDPNVSLEDHLISVTERVDRLRSIQ